jgi:hypothetical protein
MKTSRTHKEATSCKVVEAKILSFGIHISIAKIP